MGLIAEYFEKEKREKRNFIYYEIGITAETLYSELRTSEQMKDSESFYFFENYLVRNYDRIRQVEILKHIFSMFDIQSEVLKDVKLDEWKELLDY